MPRPTLDPETPSGRRLDGVTHNMTAELWMLAGIYDELVFRREGTPEVRKLREAQERATRAAIEKLTPETTAEVAAKLKASAAGKKLKPKPKG